MNANGDWIGEHQEPQAQNKVKRKERKEESSVEGRKQNTPPTKETEVWDKKMARLLLLVLLRTSIVGLGRKG